MAMWRPVAEGQPPQKAEARVFHYVYHYSYFPYLLTKDVAKLGISNISGSSIAPIAAYDILFERECTRQGEGQREKEIES